MRIVAAAALASLAACVGPGLLTDGTSVSVYTTSRGSLIDAAWLPPSGEGYVVPPRWKARDRSWGTDEMVGLIVRSARHVARRYRKSVVGIADISPREGGKTKEHRSHRSGRDVDIIFYATDLRARPIAPLLMINYDSKGESVAPKAQPNGSQPNGAQATAAATPATRDAGAASASAANSLGAANFTEPPYTPRRFDKQRNWALIRAMLVDPLVRVQWIFIGKPLKKLLLAHAKRKKAPAWLVARADAVMHQPGDAQNHMDHMHVRIFCAPADRALGCVDYGPKRWLKKTIKYDDQPPPRLPPGLADLKLPLHNVSLR
ncbi:MAG: penicillin-insensitive murein endopeptidase [Myxococcales bacterium]|nr:penicillin-insensitive murein endopeptidase [Myxococcales bacterium]